MRNKLGKVEQKRIVPPGIVQRWLKYKGKIIGRVVATCTCENDIVEYWGLNGIPKQLRSQDMTGFIRNIKSDEQKGMLSNIGVVEIRFTSEGLDIFQQMSKEEQESLLLA